MLTSGQVAVLAQIAFTAVMFVMLYFLLVFDNQVLARMRGPVFLGSFLLTLTVLLAYLGAASLSKGAEVTASDYTPALVFLAIGIAFAFGRQQSTVEFVVLLALAGLAVGVGFLAGIGVQQVTTPLVRSYLVLYILISLLVGALLLLVLRMY